VYNAWKDRGVRFVGIGLLASKEEAAAFVRRHGLTFPNGHDGAGRVAKLYGFSHQPYWAVVARDGTLIKAGFGPTGEEELVSAVRQVTGR
jgi:peroxiredoxin